MTSLEYLTLFKAIFKFHYTYNNIIISSPTKFNNTQIYCYLEVRDISDQI